MSELAQALALTTAHSIRAVLYIWALFEALFLAYLYGMAANKMKNTPIIKSVHWLFVSLVMLFFWLAVLPLAKIAAPSFYDLLVLFAAVPAGIAAAAMRLFRIWSLENPASSQVQKTKPLKMAIHKARKILEK